MGRFYHRYVKWGKRLLWLYIILLALSWAQNPDHRGALFTIFGLALQIGFVIVFILIQFVAMFWYLSRSREETILPGQAGTVTLSDYWGQPQIVEIVRQWVSLLKGVRKFQQMGGQLPNGVMLVGPPGSGKSYLAKAIAGSCGLPFVSMDASSFTNMFMGIGAMKVIRFFRKARALAREYGGCIIFLDEIDAIARSRGGVMQASVKPLGIMMGGMGGGSMELSTILYELDGNMERTRSERIMARLYGLLGKKLPPRNWTVFTMAATNVPQAIDPALTRAGRLDRRLVVNSPDRAGRREIIKGYLDKIVHDAGAGIDVLTDEMAGMTPAEIKMAVTSEAPRKALFRNRDRVEMADLKAAVNELTLGIKNPIRDILMRDKELIAAHEAGHAVLAWVLTDYRLAHGSIVRYTGEGESLGHILPREISERHVRSLADHWHLLIMVLGGRAGEIVRYGEPQASVGGDLHQAMHIAETLLQQGFWGTPVTTEDERMNQTKWLFDQALEQAVRLLREHEDWHTIITTTLLEEEEIDHERVAALLGERPKTRVPLPQVEKGKQ